MNLFDPLQIRDVTFRNRIAVSPMCQYSSIDGAVDDWHLVHLGARAAGGAGAVLTEAMAVVPEGRISPFDLGLWNDTQAEALARVVRFVHAQGAVFGPQLAHAGFKASTQTPWQGHGKTAEAAEGGWTPVYGPSAKPFSPSSLEPVAMTAEDIARVVRAFAEAAGRALETGCNLLEIHAAHGYLLHEFLTPLVNLRTDEYGGTFENRTRLVREVVVAVREVWPERLPLWLRISGTDWSRGGWTVEDSVALAMMVKPLGVDLIDCSSGGAVPRAEIPVGPGYQVGLSEQVRRGAGMLTGAVGLITSPQQAQAILAREQADVVLLGREMLRDPHWPLRAAHELKQEAAWPVQYERAKW
ncbi:MAG: NADH:flavin oxidoreductase/NADH oxidase [Acidobacteriota bacterium]|nr:NADH:flavin oxidoreductase/NADH oxidase [Acidobacteriota bacterium]